jgi:hypothetical protein
MVSSSFDRWLTMERSTGPLEVTSSDYENDCELQEIAPPDEARCTRCNDIIGFYLDIDPETTADRPAFRQFWIMDEDATELFCEDCVIEVTEEVH